MTAGRAPRAGRDAARSARAEASGSSGQRARAASVGAALEASTPAFAHTKPWRVRQISTPARRARLGRLVEDHLHERAGPCRARSASSAARARRRRRRGRRRAPPPSTPPCARPRPRRRSQAAGAPAAPRSARRGRRPGRPPGAPGSGDERAARVIRRPHAARARRACRGARARRVARAPRRSAARSSGVSTSSISDGTSRDPVHHARRLGGRTWRARLSGPKLGSNASGGVEQQRVRARPVAVGHDHDLASRRRARQQRVDLGRVEQRRVARHEQHARRSRARERPRDRRAARRPTGRLARVVATTWRRRRARRPRAPGRAVTTTTSRSPSTFERASTSWNIACASARRLPDAEPRRRGAACAAEALDGQDGGGPHGATLSARSTPAALTRAREDLRGIRGELERLGARGAPSASSISVSAISTGAPSTPRSSATRRRSRPRRRARSPAAPSGSPAAPERRGRALQDLAADDGAPRRPARAASRSASRMPGTRQDRADRDHRVRRADHDRAGGRDRVEHLRASARAARCRRTRRPRPGPRARSRIMNSWKAEPAAAREHPRAHGSSHIGSTRARHAERRGHLARAPRSARALGQPPRALQAERQVAVAEVEPESVAELAQRRPSLRTCRRRGPSRARRSRSASQKVTRSGSGETCDAVDLDVVAGVGDHDQLVADHVEHPAGELRAAGAAGEDDYRRRPAGR